MKTLLNPVKMMESDRPTKTSTGLALSIVSERRVEFKAMRHSRAPKRRWYQSGLRTLLACVFVIAASHSSVPRNRRRSI